MSWQVCGASGWGGSESPRSLRASRVRTACSVGIIVDVGSAAWRTTAARSSRRIKGTKRKSPPTRVRNDRGARLKVRTSATAAASGFTRGGRSCSSRRGRRAEEGERPSRGVTSRSPGPPDGAAAACATPHPVHPIYALGQGRGRRGNGPRRGDARCTGAASVP